MMDLRKKIFLIAGISAGLIIALLLLYFYVFAPGAPFKILPIQKQNTPIEQGGTNNAPATSTPVIRPTAKKTAPDAIYAKQIATIFVERFGTYSNQNSNSHLDDAIALSTDSMITWLKKQTLPQSLDYHGFNTKVVAVSIAKIDDKNATVNVSAQVVEENKNVSTTIYKNGRVELVRVGDDWKVDGLYWDK